MTLKISTRAANKNGHDYVPSHSNAGIPVTEEKPSLQR
jgi:hypothetical protein